MCTRYFLHVRYEWSAICRVFSGLANPDLERKPQQLSRRLILGVSTVDRVWQVLVTLKGSPKSGRPAAGSVRGTGSGTRHIKPSGRHAAHGSVGSLKTR